MIEREDRAVFTEQLRERRRARGRPRGAVVKVPKCVFLPVETYDEFCRRALVERRSVNQVIADALVAAVHHRRVLPV